MAARAAKCQGKAMSDKDKAERLAAKLRENLRRRKVQARALDESASAPAQAGAQIPEEPAR